MISMPSLPVSAGHDKHLLPKTNEQYTNHTISSSSSTSHDSIDSRNQSMIAKSRMQPTTRSVITEMSVLSLGISFALVHYFVPTNIAIMCVSGTSLIVSGAIWFYFEVHKRALACVMRSFRGFIITTCIITIAICDIANKYISSYTEPIYIILINDICWGLAILVLCGADCCPRITNFFRFVGPLSALLNAIHNIFLYSDEPEVVLFVYKNGEISFQQISKIATVELILFSASFIMSFPRDRDHEYFVILNNRIPKKKLIPHLNIATHTTNICGLCEIHSKWLFVILAICATFATVVCLCDIDQLLIIIVLDVIAIIIVLVIICVFVYYYFHTTIMKYAITQFRFNMLSLSVVIIIYAGIQQLIWDSTSQKLFHGILMSLGAFLLLIRDPLSITYPFYFTLFLSLLMFTICAVKIYLLTFIYNNEGQQWWFIWLEREAFYQVFVVCALILWNVLIKDRENTYFILIRERKKCKQLFHDTNKLYVLNTV